MRKSGVSFQRAGRSGFSPSAFKTFVLPLVLITLTNYSKSLAGINNSQGCFVSNYRGQNSTEEMLAVIGREIARPYPVSASLTDTRNEDVKSLPGLPAGISLVLTGFFCISLARDRKFWLALAAGILWAGQVGLEAVPEITKGLSTRIRPDRYFCTNCVLLSREIDSNRLRCDIEGSGFIGLLYHCSGIPEDRKTPELTAQHVSRDIPLATDKNHFPVQALLIPQLPKFNSAAKSRVLLKSFIISVSAFSPAMFPRPPPLVKRINGFFSIYPAFFRVYEDVRMNILKG